MSLRSLISGQRDRNQQITLSGLISSETRPHCRNREAESSLAAGRKFPRSERTVPLATSSAIRKPGNAPLRAKPEGCCFVK
jgi:hypothetical protein